MDKRILLVEDDITMRKAIKIILDDGKYDITEAENGEKAITFLENGNFDLLITDLFLNKITGLDLFEMYNSKIPVILITGNTESYLAQKAEKIAGSSFMEKPFSPEIFKNKVNKLLTKNKI